MTTGQRASSANIAHRMAIQDVLCLHSRGLDRLDGELLSNCYWPEAEVDYGAFKGPAQTFAELVVSALRAQYELTRHCLSSSLIELHGSRAYVETPVTAGHLLQGGEEEMLFYGRYLDKLECRDGEWRISHRQVVMEWSKRHAVVDERQSDAFADLAKAGHRGNDPLYPFLASA